MNALLGLILGWYFFSISISVYNKWMFDESKGLKIAFPIFITSLHQATLFILSSIFIRCKNKANTDLGKGILSNKKRNYWRYFFVYIVPTAIVSAGDIGLSNVSLKLVPLTVYTIIKSSAIAFVLMFSVLFRLEKFHWKLIGIVSVMVTGVVLMVYSPEDPHKGENEIQESKLILGCILVVISSCLSGLRWVYTQITLHTKPSESSDCTIKEKDNESAEQEYLGSTSEENLSGYENGFQLPAQEKIGANNFTNPSIAGMSTKNTCPLENKNPVYTIHELSWIMSLALLLSSLAVEHPFPGIINSPLLRNSELELTLWSVTWGSALVLIPGIGVFMLTLCEFSILNYTQALTLSIAGIVKEIIQIFCGLIFFGERIRGLHNWVGMAITLLDVIYYNYFRYKQQQSTAPLQISESLVDHRHSSKREQEVDQEYGQNYEMESVPKTITGRSK